jgi:hypothetical protein
MYFPRALRDVLRALRDLLRDVLRVLQDLMHFALPNHLVWQGEGPL